MKRPLLFIHKSENRTTRWVFLSIWGVLFLITAWFVYKSGDQRAIVEVNLPVNTPSAAQLNLLVQDFGPGYDLDVEYTFGNQIPNAPFADAADFNRREFSTGASHLVYSTVALYSQIPQETLFSLFEQVEADLLGPEYDPDRVRYGPMLPVDVGDGGIVQQVLYQDEVFNINSYILVFTKENLAAALIDVDYFSGDIIFPEVIKSRARLIANLMDVPREQLGIRP